VTFSKFWINHWWRDGRKICIVLACDVSCVNQQNHRCLSLSKNIKQHQRQICKRWSQVCSAELSEHSYKSSSEHDLLSACFVLTCNEIHQCVNFICRTKLNIFSRETLKTFFLFYWILFKTIFHVRLSLIAVCLFYIDVCGRKRNRLVLVHSWRWKNANCIGK